MSTIRAELQLNADRFLSGIRSVDTAVSGFQRKFGSFTRNFIGLAAAGAVLVTQFAQVKAALDLGGHLSDISANTGQSISDLVVLRQAYANAGAGAESVAPSLALLAKALTGVNEEGKPTTDVFENIGVSIQSLRAMSAIEQLTTLGAAIRAMPNPSDRARAAMDLFGRSGSKMLALFEDTSALTTARAQVGDLATTMQSNAAQFDAISDSIGALQLKFEQFYSGLAAGATENAGNPLRKLTEMDFTGLGENVGHLAASIATLMGWLAKLTPLIAGLGSVMLATSLKARLAGTEMAATWRVAYQAPIYQLAVLRTQLATTGASFTSFAAVARAGMMGAASAVATGARAILAALGPIGLTITAATAGFGYLMNKAEQIKSGTRAITGVSKDANTAAQADFATAKSVASESERTAALQKLDEQAAEVSERLRNVQDDYEDLREEDRAFITTQFEQWAHRIEVSRRSLAKLTPEIMAARKAERDRAVAMEQSAKAAEKLREDVAKGFGELDKAKAEDAFAAIPALEQRAQLLKDAGAATTEAVDAELRWLHFVTQRRTLTDEEAQRAAKLLEIRTQLVKTERDITNERKKQAEEAAEKARKAAQDAAEAKAKREDFERDFGLELKKLFTEALGDENATRIVEREQRRQQYLDQAKAAGEDDTRAQKLATARVDLEDAAESRKQEQKKAEDARRASIIADSDRRVGLGGIAASTKQDPLVKANQDATRATHALTSVMREVKQLLQRSPERMQPLVPVFQ
jgi:hypothetical protein